MNGFGVHSRTELRRNSAEVNSILSTSKAADEASLTPANSASKVAMQPHLPAESLILCYPTFSQ